MLTKENKKLLRSMAHQLNANIQIGKGGLSENLMNSLDIELEAHELVKVTLLKTCDLDVNEAAVQCAADTRSDIVQMIGRTFVLYRQSKDNKLGLKA